MKVNFSPSDFRRKVADADSLVLKNRYFESNPFLSDDGASLLARPGLDFLTTVGAGPIRGIYSEPGTFNGSLFVASYDTLYQVKTDLTKTIVRGNLFDPERGFVSMAITGNIGDVPEMLFFADGRNLFVYIEDGYAHNNLVGVPANNDVVRINAMYYKFTSGSVDAGTPDGTSGNPWLVALGVSGAQAITNMAQAIEASGDEGSQYSTALEPNAAVKMLDYSTDTIQIQAATPGIIGNVIPTTETGANLAWSEGATLAGGGDAQSRQITTPDDVGVIDVAVINSYVIVIPAQGEGINGRFFWIEPGETTINPLNFATAERSPDPIFGVKVIGDQFWLPGESTTEVWYVASDPNAPMQRLQGVVFDRGTWDATAAAIDEQLVVCDADGAVFLISGGSPQRVSTPDIEEEIRKAIQTQQLQTII